jgi:hypothetical protein
MQTWGEETRLVGDVYVSINTNSPYQTQRLYQSSQRNFYVVTISNYPESVADTTAAFVTERQACAWICENSHTIPDSLLCYDTGAE